MYYLYNSCIALHTLNSTSCSVKAQGLAHAMFWDDEDILVAPKGRSSKRDGDASDLKAASKANKKRRCSAVQFHRAAAVPNEKVANEKVANEKKGKQKSNEKVANEKVANEKVANEKTTDMQKATQAFITELRRLAKVMLES